ncbi:MAG: prepilin-type N-terminal cleavage/methylation domain-containing protein [Campylobacterales bacterium]|nr:prepilin-type N-terminal cleavage/methylation domain-containing protein [Campylobacterales bacterium]
MKKAFTLIEVVISITLFSIILLFMYKTLDLTKHTNKLFEDKVKKSTDINKFKNIILEDILESSSIKQLNRINDFYILEIKTSNMYNNNFYEYVYYLVSKKKNLFRIESKNIINVKSFREEFLDNTYISLIEKDIEKFELAKFKKSYKKNNVVTILFKQKNKKAIFLNAIQFNKSIQTTQ